MYTRVKKTGSYNSNKEYCFTLGKKCKSLVNPYNTLFSFLIKNTTKDTQKV